MYVHRPLPNNRIDEAIEARQTAGLVGMVIVLLLLVAGLFLVQQLRTSAVIQDCIMAGRTNCGAPIAESR